MVSSVPFVASPPLIANPLVRPLTARLTKGKRRRGTTAALRAAWELYIRGTTAALRAACPRYVYIGPRYVPGALYIIRLLAAEGRTPD